MSYKIFGGVMLSLLIVVALLGVESCSTLRNTAGGIGIVEIETGKDMVRDIVEILVDWVWGCLMKLFGRKKVATPPPMPNPPQDDSTGTFVAPENMVKRTCENYKKELEKVKEKVKELNHYKLNCLYRDLERQLSMDCISGDFKPSKKILEEFYKVEFELNWPQDDTT
jgi:hypothetical protein